MRRGSTIWHHLAREPPSPPPCPLAYTSLPAYPLLTPLVYTSLPAYPLLTPLAYSSLYLHPETLAAGDGRREWVVWEWRLQVGPRAGGGGMWGSQGAEGG